VTSPTVSVGNNVTPVWKPGWELGAGSGGGLRTADCGEEWSREAINLAVARGPHPTAAAAEAVDTVQEDIECQVKAGFVEAVFWDEIKDGLRAHFEASPVAVAPQTGW
jgi:hypothetical protein